MDVQILSRQDGVEVTWESWNRGEPQNSLSAPESEHSPVPGVAVTSAQCGSHLYGIRGVLITLSMATPSQRTDWSPVPSVEDCTLPQEYGTPLFAGEDTPVWDAPTPALYTNSQGQRRWTRSVSMNSIEPQPRSLTFVQMKDWNQDAAYDQMPPTHIHYRLEWKLMINRSIECKNTEDGIVLEPTSYGPHILQPRLEALLKRKVIPPRSVQAVETDVEVKVTGRSQEDFVTQYERSNIDWLQVERQLLKCGGWFSKGKKLRVIICFRYREVNAATNTQKSNGKRGRGSASEQMRAELTDEVDAEQAVTSRPAAWQHVYALFRCPGPPCDLKPWCWFDSRKNKRFELKAHHLRTLVRHKQSDQSLDTHDQIPETLREQIYREVEQSERHKQTQNTIPTSGILPIHITNVLPNHASMHPETASKAEASPVEFFGLRDEDLQDYCDWQQTQVRKPSLKAAYQKLTDFVVDSGLDLELLHDDQDPQSLANEAGVPIGIARRYYRDIKRFAKHGAKRRKLDHAVASSQQATDHVATP